MRYIKSFKETKTYSDSLLEKSLTAAERDKLPSIAFVFPETRSYPIHDKEHAIAAIGMVAQNGTDPEKKRVVAAVQKRYPEMKIDIPEIMNKTPRKSSLAEANKQAAGDDSQMAYFVLHRALADIHELNLKIKKDGKGREYLEGKDRILFRVTNSSPFGIETNLVDAIKATSIFLRLGDGSKVNKTLIKQCRSFIEECYSKIKPMYKIDSRKL